MYKGNSSRFVPIIVVLIVIAVAVAALVSLGKAMFSDTSKTPEAVDTSQQSLLSTVADRSVRMTVRGPIVADENFRSYQVIITPSSRTVTTYSGYLDKTLSTNTFGNNVKAYEEFVYALDKADMVKGTQLAAEADDIRGVCATGKVYEFDTLSAGKSTKHLWTSTCKGSRGSFNASVTQVQNLFTEQIPDAAVLLKAVDL